MNTRLEQAYILWGVCWWIIGIYDAWFWDRWCEKYFTSLLTLAIFAIYIGYLLGKVEVLERKWSVLYYVMYLIGIDLWNASWFFHAYFFTDWKPRDTIWLMPNCVVPIWAYYAITFGGTTAWIAFLVLAHYDRIKIPCVDKYF